MGFGENLQFLRKRENITQEQLAEKLSVSRQSVSKWESESSYPEMDKILQMCEMFHCNMDTLLRGSIEENNIEDTARYEAHMNQFSLSIATGVALILIGIGTNQIMESAGIMESISTMIMLSFFAVAICTFVVSGIKHSIFCKRYPEIQQFYTKAEIERFEKKYPVLIGFGVTFIILAVIFQVGMESVPAPAGFHNDFYAGFFFYMLSVAIFSLIYAGMQKNKYDIKNYNKENEEEDLKEMSKIGKWCGVIMLVATMLFLSSIAIEIYRSSGDWGNWRGSIMSYSWVVFPLGGMLCGIVSIILKQEK